MSNPSLYSKIDRIEILEIEIRSRLAFIRFKQESFAIFAWIFGDMCSQKCHFFMKKKKHYIGPFASCNSLFRRFFLVESTEIGKSISKCKIRYDAPRTEAFKGKNMKYPFSHIEKIEKQSSKTL